ncbi:MAG: hypothetical protein AAGD33_03250 [Actinomycetota bacterium]
MSCRHNNPAIRRFIEARQASEYAIVLLIEHVNPSWLADRG